LYWELRRKGNLQRHVDGDPSSAEAQRGGMNTTLWVDPGGKRTGIQGSPALSGNGGYQHGLPLPRGPREEEGMV